MLGDGAVNRKDPRPEPRAHGVFREMSLRAQMTSWTVLVFLLLDAALFLAIWPFRTDLARGTLDDALRNAGASAVQRLAAEEPQAWTPEFLVSASPIPLRMKFMAVVGPGG